MSIRPYCGEYLISPVALHMGLNWCTHGCFYCSREDMLITLGDLTSKAAGNIQVGDEVLGWTKRTVQHAPRGRHGVTESSNRNFAVTRVEDVFTREAPVMRVVLDGAADVFCTPDHHWFTGRTGDWEYAPLVGQRGLRPAASLLRLRMLQVEKLPKTDDYLLGYLRGYAAGDGTWMPQGTWRFASKDIEPIARVSTALKALGAPAPDPVPFQRGMQCITLPVGHAANDIINGFDLPRIEYWRGWLAGIYDAEGNTPARLDGNRSGEALRIAQVRQHNPLTYDRILEALRRFGFGYVAEARAVRLQGGRTEAARFVQTVQPAIPRKQNPLVGTGHKGMVERVKVLAVEDAGTAPVVSFRTGTGNYVSGGYLSRNCFANLNRPGRRADYPAIKNFLAAYTRGKAGKNIAVHLALQGHPILASNDSDPFAASNGEQNIALMRTMMDAGLRFSFQTRGGKGAEELLADHPPTMVYISVTTDNEATRKAAEPGAPSFEARKALALACKAAGHFVVIGINPFYPPWWDDIEGFLEWMAEHGIRHAWVGGPHLNYMQERAMADKVRQRFAGEIQYFKSGPKARGNEVEALRDACSELGINTFAGDGSKHGHFWDDYFALGFPHWPTLEGFFDHLQAQGEGGPMAFTFDYFHQWADTSEGFTASAYKDFIAGIGRSIRNVGLVQRAGSMREVHEWLWRIHEFPTRLNHNDIFLGTQDGHLAVDESGRFVLVHARGVEGFNTGRHDLDACVDILGLEDEGTAP